MARYRFKDAMGDVVAGDEFSDHAAALMWARDSPDHDEELERVKILGP